MTIHRICDLYQWYKTELGRRVMHAEISEIERIGASLFGCNSVQLGMFPGAQPHMPSILRQISIMPGQIQDAHYIHSEFINLPIQSRCVDVMFALHVLEFSDNPYQLLREIERALDDDGQLIVTAFNPFSLAGAMRVAWPFKRRAVPWCGHYFSRTRVVDWLRLLNFEVVNITSVFHNIPVQNKMVLDRGRYFASKLRRIFPGGGATYIIHAKKRTMPLSPIRPRWRPRRAIVPASVDVATRGVSTCVTEKRENRLIQSDN